MVNPKHGVRIELVSLIGLFNPLKHGKIVKYFRKESSEANFQYIESIFCSCYTIDMHNTRDNWEKLVRIVLDREKLKELAMCDSLRSDCTSFDYGSSRIIYAGDLDCNQTGGKQISVGARKLGIAWGDEPRYWRWKSHPDSRFSEVAHLTYVCWFDIQCKIGTHMLSQKTSYGAYLVFKLEDYNRGLESVDGVVKINKFEKEVVVKREVYMTQAALMREDGWMEVELGVFFNDEGKDGEVVAQVINTNNGYCSIIVEAIEFRPSDDSQN